MQTLSNDCQGCPDKKLDKTATGVKSWEVKFVEEAGTAGGREGLTAIARKSVEILVFFKRS